MTEKKKNLRIAGIVLVFAAAVLALIAGFLVIRKGNLEEKNEQTAAFLGAVKTAYPDVTDTELIRVLRESGDPEAGRALLRKYGYTEAYVYADGDRHAENRYLLYGIAVLSAGAAAFALLQMLAAHREENRLKELMSYVRQINSGVYDLKPAENAEGVYSQLTNEICKTMVLLKEGALSTAEKNENLTRALEDISHQLKTPVTSIRILTENMYEDPQMDPAVRQEFLGLVNRQTDYLSELVLSLLDLARFDSGTVLLQPKPVTARALIGSVTEDLAIMMEAAEVSAEISGDLEAEILLDPVWQKEALKNIVKNAVEHSPAGSCVHIRSENSALFLKIIIRDEGEGIARADLRHIFERFYKAAGSNADSVGIGLAFAKTVIEREGGYILADSTPGEGAVFTVFYKKRTAAEAAPDLKESPENIVGNRQL